MKPPHNTPNFYAILPASVRYDKRLTFAEKVIFAEISALTNKTGICWAGNKYFADLYGVSTRTVSRWFMKLEKTGHITIELEDRHIRWTKMSMGWTQMSKGVDMDVYGGIDIDVYHNNTSTINTLVNKGAVKKTATKKKKPATKKKETSETVAMRKKWEGLIESRGSSYEYAAKDYVALKQIKGKLKRAVEKSGREGTEDVVLQSWQVVLERLPPWYLTQGLSLPIINSKFNELITEIKNKQGAAISPEQLYQGLE